MGTKLSNSAERGEKSRFSPKLISVLLSGSLVCGTLSLVACGGGGGDGDSSSLWTQPVLGNRTKAIITVDSYKFKDLNGNGKLDPYEDWRLSVDERSTDLIAKMSDTEKVGMLMINDNNAGCEGSVTPAAAAFVTGQKMTRFILRTTAAATAESCAAAPANSRGGYVVTPQQLASYTNSLQAVAEGTSLGIPLVFKDNARNHVETDPRQGISAGAGAFTQFPKEAGLAAAALGEQFLKEGKATTGDMSVINTFTQVMGPEYNAVGLRGLYGYMADLLTEPRWYRAHEVFTEDADLNANIMKSLVEGLQGTTVKDGTSVTPKSYVAMTMKHFPGAGPQELGMDAHYSFGKYQRYDGNFAYHLKPFIAGITAGVSSIMPYYAIAMTGRDANKQPTQLTYDGLTFPLTGFSFSKDMVDGLLRGKLGFQGYVNTDTGIVTMTPWGMEWKSEQVRIATAINAGADTLSGYSTNSTIKALLDQGLITQTRLNQAVKRLLKEQFQLGLFENPYVDPSQASSVIGNADSVAKALELYSVDGSEVDGLTVEGVRAYDALVALNIRLGARLRPSYWAKGTAPKVGCLRNIRIRDVEAEVGSRSWREVLLDHAIPDAEWATGTPEGPYDSCISGLPDHPVENVVIEGFKVRVPGGATEVPAAEALPERPEVYPHAGNFGVLPAYGLFVRHATNVTVRRASFTAVRPDARPPVASHDAPGFRLE